jgi:hypothetical protein
MADRENTEERPSEMLATRLGPPGAGLPPIPEPATWDTAYGIDEAVAIAVVPQRALIFWELAEVISAGVPEGVEFRLVRIRLEGEVPEREESWPIAPIGRFQDGGVESGKEYLYVISRVDEDGETPLMVTNPIRMPLTYAPATIPSDMPSSIELFRAFEKAAKEKKALKRPLEEGD